MRNLLKQILIGFIIFLALASIFSFFSSPLKEAKEVNLTELARQINDGKVNSIIISENNLEIVMVDGTKEKSRKESESSLTESLKNYGIDPERINAVNITVEEKSGFWYWFGALLPFILPVLLIILFIYLMTRQLQRGSMQAFTFGKSRARLVNQNGKKDKITFKDVAGNEEAKEELKEIVEFLKSPKKFYNIGAKIPHGVLLFGAPGTGKTLLAKAVAGEAEVPFFNISGSEFVEMFVGVGASRVRDLFQTAKKAAPCIIFIDEIDAVGRHRGAGLGGGHDEREQTLNQILVEMDGFETTDSIIVMAATNRPDILDPALLRPGRFDRRVILDQPDMNSREAILNIHIRNKPIEKNVNLRQIAERTPGFSGADLENLINEAAILAARRNKKALSQEELIQSIEKVLLGPERKSHILTKREKEITAYHEAGHALVAAFLPECDPVHKISIISRGHAAGYTLKLPVEDKHLYSRTHFLSEIAVALGGYLAEKMVFGDITTGASNDLQKASDLTRKIVTQYGMSEKLGPITFGEKEELVFLGKEISTQRNYSEAIAEKIDKEVARIIKSAIQKAKKIIINKKALLDKIAKILIKKETIEREEFEALIATA